jgi:hypothetical protein
VTSITSPSLGIPIQSELLETREAIRKRFPRLAGSRGILSMQRGSKGGFMINPCKSRWWLGSNIHTLVSEGGGGDVELSFGGRVAGALWRVSAAEEAEGSGGGGVDATSSCDLRRVEG